MADDTLAKANVENGAGIFFQHSFIETNEKLLYPKKKFSHTGITDFLTCADSRNFTI